VAYRKNGYLYRSVRRGNLVKTEYLGRGEAAELVEKLDAADLEARRAELADRRQRERSERETFREACGRASGIDRLVDLGLEAAGFHRPQRHSWRRRRETMGVALASIAAGPEVRDRIRELSKLVREKDDRAALAELRRLAGRHPGDLVEVLHADLARLLEGNYVAAVAGAKDVELALGAQLRSLREELLAGSESAALRLAVEAAAYRWLDHWWAELPASKGQAVSAALERRRNWAHRRLLQALAAVERIRRLTRPRGPKYAVQIIQDGTVPPPALDVEAAGDGRTLEVTDDR
jgi:hypothetical protein